MSRPWRYAHVVFALTAPALYAVGAVVDHLANLVPVRAR